MKPFKPFRLGRGATQTYESIIRNRFTYFYMKRPLLQTFNARKVTLIIHIAAVLLIFYEQFSNSQCIY
jgi:hypothetical protein